MAHEIDMTKGFAAMAYVGETPWHGLGQQLQAGASIEQWQEAAGMDFSILETRALFQENVGMGEILEVPDRKVLYRSDNSSPLAVVSNRYQIVQPAEVLEFYRDLTEKSGFQLETAGVLKGGRKYWALANMGKEAKVLDDTLKGYLLLGTACDGSMATTAMFTSIRVVCNNTLSFAMEEANSGKVQNLVRINHRTVFDDQKVKAQLGLAATSWDSFIKHVDAWSNTGVSNEQALDYFSEVAVYTDNDGDTVVSNRTVELLNNLFHGDGIGADMKAAKGTVWGLVNAVTEYVDHHKGRSNDVRMDSAWFGDGRNIKAKAAWLADELVDV
jgi:phage/plasmid-like protein (TIGR03299 family)